MRSLPLISLICILLLPGCHSIKPAGLKLTGNSGTSSCKTAETPDISLFKATLEIKKHRLTGLLIMKRVDSLTGTNPGSGKIYRIVFSNEIGMTFFDLEISGNTLKVHSCFSSLNKKALLNILKTDFQVLTNVNGFIPEQFYTQNISGNQVQYGRSGSLNTWKVFAPSGDTTYSISARSNLANSVSIDFSTWSNGHPGTIVLKNPFIGMKLSLRRLK